MKDLHRVKIFSTSISMYIFKDSIHNASQSTAKNDIINGYIYIGCCPALCASLRDKYRIKI